MSPSNVRKKHPNATHGGKGTRLYRIWTGMRTRCFNERAREYPLYGGRGITICDEWMDFARFREWALANGYRNKLTIERVDNDGNYAPENCRWIPLGEQALNRSNTIVITFRGRTQPLVVWSEETGIPYPTLFARLRYRGWSVERALTTPVKTKEAV